MKASRGWDLLCPYSFEAYWNGGPEPEDIWISAPGFAVSRAGHGVLTLQTGYEIELDTGHDLWLRAPINRLKDGIQPLDQVIESDLLPVVAEVHWRFTRSNTVVRFERSEPCATILPYPAGYIELFRGEVTQPAEPATANLPGVSCICPTYARPALLEEAIHSFLIQDYPGSKELIVLNDYAGQTLAFEHPDVQIVNLPERFHSLGEKLNAAVALCSHDLIFVWSDDDIYLPHRISLSVERFDRRRGFFKAGKAFFWNDGAITGLEANRFHGGSCWSRDLFTQVRGYPHGSVGVDGAIEMLFGRQRFESGQPDDLAPDETYYLYRWAGTGSYHLSVLGAGTPGDNANYDAAGGWVAAAAARGEIPRGEIRLRPGWRQDYATLAQRFLSAPRDVTDDPLAAAPAVPPPIAFSRLPEPVDPACAPELFHGGYARKISVILPAANEAPFLQRTFEQFRDTLPDGSEIIVVDNGSTDGCADFLENCAEHLTRDAGRSAVRCEAGAGVSARLFQSGGPLGVAGARNTGLEYAQGEIVVFADAHVDVPPGWWQPMVATLNRPGVGLAGPAFGVLGDPDYIKMYGQYIKDAALRTQWLPKREDCPYPVPVLGGGFMALRREVLDAIGGFDAGMLQWGSEDLELSLRTWLMGYEVWMVPEVEIPHYFRSKNPYHVEWKHVAANHLRTVFLHLSGERLARALHNLAQDSNFPRTMAMCVESDLWARRAELHTRRVHDDDWFFSHPYFRDIEMDV